MRKYTILLPLLALFFFTFAVASHAAVTYPIRELGNCKNRESCAAFCTVPKNTPICWSYNKFILNKDVLGEVAKSPDQIAAEHGIIFPVADLGNCSSGLDCMNYCNVPANKQVCYEFGKKKGIIKKIEITQGAQPTVNEEKILAVAKEKLGCTSKQTCLSFCDDPKNQSACQQFASEEGLSTKVETPTATPIPQRVVESAKQELGCKSEATCASFCSNSANFQKCQEFAEKHKLIAPTDIPPQTESSYSNIKQYYDYKNSVSTPSGTVYPTRKYEQPNTYPSYYVTPTYYPTHYPTKGTQYSYPSSYPTNYVTPTMYPNREQYYLTKYPTRPPITPYPTYKTGNQQYYPTYVPPATYITPTHAIVNTAPTPTYRPVTQPTSVTSLIGCTTEQECYLYCLAHIGVCPGFTTAARPPSTPTPVPTRVPPTATPYPTYQVPTNYLLMYQTRCAQMGCVWTGNSCNCSASGTTTTR